MIFTILKSLLFIIGFTFFASSAAASLDKAVEAWLADDDKTALPMLSTLASDGDVDAQVLLGVIATRPHSLYVTNLSRKERNRLLRAPGGLSGKSWLKVAAEAGDARATALIAVEAPPFELEAIRILLKLGEDDAAATALLRAAQYFPMNSSKDALDLDVPADIAYALTLLKISANQQTVTLSWTPSDDLLKLVEALAAGAVTNRRPSDTNARDISLRLFPGKLNGTDAEKAGALLGALAPSSRPAQRLLTFCEAACPETLNACMGDTVGLLSGYNQLWRFGSPLNTLISEDQYLASPRLHADIARQMTTLMKGWSQSRQANWSTKSCAAASRFRTYFP